MFSTSSQTTLTSQDGNIPTSHQSFGPHLVNAFEKLSQTVKNRLLAQHHLVSEIPEVQTSPLVLLHS